MFYGMEINTVRASFLESWLLKLEELISSQIVANSRGNNMGNRAVILFQDEKTYNGGYPAVYLHWDGSPEQVVNVLAYCKARKFETGDYGVARFCQVFGNVIGGDLSIGINTIDADANLEKYGQGDNGIYIVKNWEIIKSTHYYNVSKFRALINEETLEEINEYQNARDRLSSNDIIEFCNTFRL